MKTVDRVAAVVLAGLFVWVVLAAGPRAQPQDQTNSAYAGLVQEVHQLRLAVEDSTRSQTQIQALSVYLSAEQSRLVQVSSRLDTVRAELTAATAHAKELAVIQANEQAELSKATLPAEARTQMEADLRMLKERADQASEAEQTARARESELAQALQTEEVHWADLIGRLEQMVRK